MIANLEKVVHFLKTEIETKNEPIKNFRITMFLEMGKFRYLHAYQVTKISMNTNIDKQLKAIREEKHKEYLQNTSRKSPPRENIVIEANEKNDRDETNEQPNDKNEVKNKQDERGNQYCWPSGTCAIVGDSMVNGIDEKRLSQKYGNVKIFHFSGARIEDLNHYIVPIIKNKPDYLILPARWN